MNPSFVLARSRRSSTLKARSECASSVFTRATQAKRQPGSSFKPFVYAAALDSGYTPATIVVDEPGLYRLTDGERSAVADSDIVTALEKADLGYTVDPGEGVFYGPKIDMKARDVIGREEPVKVFQVLERVMILRKRHCAGIKPYINQFGCS